MAIYSGFTPWKWWFSIVMLVYQRVCTVETQLETRVLQCALMGQGCFALPDTTTSFAKDSAVSFSWCQGPTEWKKNRTYSVSPTYIYNVYIYISISPLYHYNYRLSPWCYYWCFHNITIVSQFYCYDLPIIHIISPSQDMSMVFPSYPYDIPSIFPWMWAKQ